MSGNPGKGSGNRATSSATEVSSSTENENSNLNLLKFLNGQERENGESEDSGNKGVKREKRSSERVPNCYRRWVAPPDVKVDGGASDSPSPSRVSHLYPPSSPSTEHSRGSRRRLKPSPSPPVLNPPPSPSLHPPPSPSLHHHHLHTDRSVQTTDSALHCIRCSHLLSPPCNPFTLPPSPALPRADIVLVNSTAHITHSDSLFRAEFEDHLIEELGATIQKIKSYEKEYVYTVIGGGWECLVEIAVQFHVSCPLNVSSTAPHRVR